MTRPPNPERFDTFVGFPESDRKPLPPSANPAVGFLFFSLQVYRGSLLVRRSERTHGCKPEVVDAESERDLEAKAESGAGSTPDRSELLGVSQHSERGPDQGGNGGTLLAFAGRLGRGCPGVQVVPGSVQA